MKTPLQRLILIAGIAILELSNTAIAQTLQWANQMGGTTDDVGVSMAVDALGNVYTTGSFTGTVDFDPGAGTFNLTSAGSKDLFISKVDAGGNFLWAKQMGSTQEDVGTSIAIDGSGNVYTTGYFRFTVDFDPGPAVFNLTTTLNGTDVFILKLNSVGDFVWAKQVGGQGVNTSTSMKFDSFGNIYVSGNFDQTTDFDPGAGVFNLTSLGFNDVFTLKLDANGDFLWAKQLGGTDTYVFSNSMSLDVSGNVYTTGSFIDVVDFNPGTGTFNMTSSSFSDDIFISKLDASGNFVWAKKIGGASTDVGYAIAVDDSGNVYTTGSFIDGVDFDPGTGTFNLTSLASSGDIFISKLNTAGNFVWAKQIGSTSTEEGIFIAIDDSYNIYTVCHFYQTIDFDPGSDVNNLTSAGSRDIAVVKLDPAGNFVSALQMGGTGDDNCLSLTMDLSGNMYTTGRFKLTGDFDPGAGVFNLTSAGGFDVFVNKFDNSITGIANEFENPVLRIYPNPTTHTIYFSSSTNIQLFNMTGQIVASGKNVNRFDLSEQPPGVYFILFTDNSGQLIQRSKIVKE